LFPTFYHPFYQFPLIFHLFTFFFYLFLLYLFPFFIFSSVVRNILRSEYISACHRRRPFGALKTVTQLGEMSLMLCAWMVQTTGRSLWPKSAAAADFLAACSAPGCGVKSAMSTCAEPRSGTALRHGTPSTGPGVRIGMPAASLLSFYAVKLSVATYLLSCHREFSYFFMRRLTSSQNIFFCYL
jgi:hypothetical protein